MVSDRNLKVKFYNRLSIYKINWYSRDFGPYNGWATTQQAVEKDQGT